MDRLIAAIREKQNPTVAGLDPKLSYIPDFIKKEAFSKYGESLEGAAEAVWQFNRGLIDALAPIVPAVKPQCAYYEQYGWQGMRTLERTAAQLLDDAASRAPAERAEPSVIARAVRYINANFCKNLRQEAVAGRFYISTPYFSRLFKQEVGMGFTEYIRKLRMEWAKSLLEETDMRIHDIARDCGYADIKHFNQTFRAYHGMSASELRKRDSRKNHPIDE